MPRIQVDAKFPDVLIVEPATPPDGLEIEVTDEEAEEWDRVCRSYRRVHAAMKARWESAYEARHGRSPY